MIQQLTAARPGAGQHAIIGSRWSSDRWSGFWGVLRGRRGSIDHLKSTVSLATQVHVGVRAADEHHDRADQRLQPRLPGVRDRRRHPRQDQGTHVPRAVQDDHRQGRRAHQHADVLFHGRAVPEQARLRHDPLRQAGGHPVHRNLHQRRLRRPGQDRRLRPRQGELPDRRHDAGDARDLPRQGPAGPDDEQSHRDDPRTQPAAVEAADRSRLDRDEAQRARSRRVPPDGQGHRRRPGERDRPVRADDRTGRTSSCR